MRIGHYVLIVFATLILVGGFAITGCNDTNGEGGDPVETGANQFTPIIISLLTEPHPVLGSDGKYHLVYELQLTNTTSLPWLINSLEALNGDDQAEVLAAFTGETVTEKNALLPGRVPSDTLEGGETSVFFITFSVESIDDIPETIVHRLALTVPGGIPEAFLQFLGLPTDDTEIIFIYAETGVSMKEPMVIGPPLRGTKWIAADGCCTAVRHIRAALPINGKLAISQRFAIDWEKLDSGDRVYVGDPLDVKSYFAYGQEILAVGNGRVVRAVDKYDDQIPGQLPPGLPIEEADGNHVVLDLGDGNFAFYAHMIKGSVMVKEGDFVTRGQLLGHVGNTGNTSAPHLHFHIMSSPETFGSNGIPYVIYEYDLLGQAPSTEAFEEAEMNGTPLEILPVPFPGTHKNDLPLDLSIVNFPGGE